MSFEGRLTNRSGQPFSPGITETLVRCVTEILLGEVDADPDKILKVAQRVGEKAEQGNASIQNLYCYTKRSLYRQVRTDRQAERERMSLLVLKDTQEIDALGATPPSIESILLIEKCLAQLSPIDRQILLLHERKDFTHAQIAATLKISVPNCWFRLSRAKQKLKQLLVQRNSQNL
jgi:DNA-directed RNA polymerase specialized sigma24 family protein